MFFHIFTPTKTVAYLQKIHIYAIIILYYAIYYKSFFEFLYLKLNGDLCYSFAYALA